MKSLILAFAFLFSTLAHAVDIEIGAGVASFRDQGDGTWYQEGLPHKLHLTTPAFELGLTDDLYRGDKFGIAWHAGYVFLGQVRTDAVATPDDANYSLQTKSCIGECLAHSNFTGRGYSHGVKLTLEPYYVYNGWRFGIEGGAYISRNVWKVTIYDRVGFKGDTPYTVYTNDDSGWDTYPVAGVSIGRGNFDVSYRIYWNRSKKGTINPAIWRRADTITLRYRF